MKNKRKNSKSGSLAGSSIRRIRKRKKIRRAVKRLMRLVFAAGIFVLTVVFIIFIAGRYLTGYSERDTKAEVSGRGKKPPDSEEEEEKIIMPEKLEEFSKMYDTNDGRYKDFTVCIDAGHGGDDSGAESLDGRYEKEQNLLLAKMVKQYVEGVGIKVVMTRQNDKTVSLKERKNIAERSGADLLVSIHRNVYEGAEEINGIEAWINNSEDERDMRAAERILKRIEDKISGVNNRGVKSGSMDNPNENYTINEALMPSMIVEVGFISSEYDNRLFNRYTEDFAMAIAEGIVESVEDIQ